MYNYKTTGRNVPESFVTKGKQRLKQYNDTVYLRNGEEFEIELFNGTTNKVLAKIELNGNSIGPGVVLRPGERIFLERFTNEAKKFLFETYVVSGADTSEVQMAIAKNGLVSVSFFSETDFYPYNCVTTINNGFHTPASNFLFTGATINSTSTNNPFYVNGLTTTTNATNSTLSFSTTATNNAMYVNNTNSNEKKTLSKELETGRVEKGDTSKQKFVYDYTNFNTFASYTSKWFIKPVSQKELVKEDLISYCGNCGSKKKKDNHKYCPHCGTKY